MIKQVNIDLPAFPQGFHIITPVILAQLPAMPDKGIVHLFIQHTSAGLSINENADPSVRIDFATIFNTLVPEGNPAYTHNMEGPDDMPAHVKASLVGSSVTIPITNSRLALGTWQGVYLCEFRLYGGSRRIVATVIG